MKTMVTTFSFPIHISSVKVAFVFVSLYEILRIQNPASVLTKGIYKRISCDIFIFYLYARQPDFLEIKNGSYKKKTLENNTKKKKQSKKKEKKNFFKNANFLYRNYIRTKYFEEKCIFRLPVCSFLPQKVC